MENNPNLWNHQPGYHSILHTRSSRKPNFWTPQKIDCDFPPSKAMVPYGLENSTVHLGIQGFTGFTRFEAGKVQQFPQELWVSPNTGGAPVFAKNRAVVGWNNSNFTWVNMVDIPWYTELLHGGLCSPTQPSLGQHLVLNHDDKWLLWDQSLFGDHRKCSTWPRGYSSNRPVYHTAEPNWMGSSSSSQYRWL